MKKYSVIFLITICSIFMLGCYSSIEIMSIGTSTSTSWYREYEKFSGTKLKKVNLEKDQAVNFDVVSEKGDLGVVIEDSDGDVVFSKEMIDTSTFEFVPKSKGKYKITFQAKNHKGGFDVYWGENNSK